MRLRRTGCWSMPFGIRTSQTERRFDTRMNTEDEMICLAGLLILLLCLCACFAREDTIAVILHKVIGGVLN